MSAVLFPTTIPPYSVLRRGIDSFFLGVVILFFINLLGYADTMWAFTALPVILFAYYWLVVRIATVEVDQ
jgi:hypothetical protein